MSKERKTTRSGKNDETPDKAEEKRRRLADALRKNLGKRRSQTRARSQASKSPDGDPPDGDHQDGDPTNK